jgi:hypothetical protein
MKVNRNAHFLSLSDDDIEKYISEVEGYLDEKMAIDKFRLIMMKPRMLLSNGLIDKEKFAHSVAWKWISEAKKANPGKRIIYGKTFYNIYSKKYDDARIIANHINDALIKIR